jgi:hypothetical protein
MGVDTAPRDKGIPRREGVVADPRRFVLCYNGDLTVSAGYATLANLKIAGNRLLAPDCGRNTFVGLHTSPR